MPENEKSEGPSLISINPIQPGVAVVTVDMGPYVDAYRDYQTKKRERIMSQTQEKQVALEYTTIRATLADSVNGLSGGLLWERFIEEATLGLSETRAQTIKTAPAAEFMRNSFVELVKNIMDEAVLGYSPIAHSPIELKMTIDDETDPDAITLTFEDTGRGFPNDFLRKTATPSEMEMYIDEAGSKKKAEKQSDSPTLFGGAGRGLRMLMANVVYGDDLVKAGVREPRYIKPEVSAITFDNIPDGTGAVMTITTSKSPLEIALAPNQFESDEEEVILEFPTLPRFGKEPAALVNDAKKLLATLRINTDSVTSKTTPEARTDSESDSDADAESKGSPLSRGKH